MYNTLLLTKNNSVIIGPVASLLGYLMNGIFTLISSLGLPSIGLAIILFTLVIYLCLMPLTIQQQKFSKLSNLMNPEIQAIQKKYQNRKDQTSQMMMNEEVQTVYKKYGVNPMGSCLQMAVQLPILFALYRVIYNFPAYVTEVKEAFFPLVTNLIAQSGSAEYLQSTQAARMFAKQFTNENFINNVGDYVSNTYIDVLNRFSTADWAALGDQFSSLSGDITTTVNKLATYNNFLGLNIGNAPSFIFREAVANRSFIGIFAAIIVPLLAAVTQLINVALMPQPQTTNGNDTQSQMANSMKTMNYMMPIMSAVFCFTLPAGMGIYWIAGSVIRSIQQVLINRRINSMDMDAYLAKNAEKIKKDAESGKKSASERVMSRYSSMSTRSIDSASQAADANADANKKETLEKAKQYYQSGKYKPGSLASKANMVSEFNNSGRNRNKEESSKNE